LPVEYGIEELRDKN